MTKACGYAKDYPVGGNFCAEFRNKSITTPIAKHKNGSSINGIGHCACDNDDNCNGFLRL